MHDPDEDRHIQDYSRNLPWERRLRPLLLWSILLIAFWFRAHSNHAGLPAPNLFHIDEDLVVERGMGIWLGLSPLLPWPGSVHMLIFALVGGIFFFITHFQQLLLSLAGNVFDVIGVFEGFYIEFFRDPTPYYILGRYLQAVIGVTGVYLVYRLGREGGDDAGGLLGAAFWALSPAGVYFGHVVNVDGLMVTLILASLLMAVRYRREGRDRDLLLAAGIGGLACAAKLNGVFILLPLFCAVLLRWWEGRRSGASLVWRPIFLVLAFFAIGFVIGCPYALTNPPVMGKMLFNVLIRMFMGDVSDGWLVLLFNQLPRAVGWVPTLLGLLGLVLLLYRQREGMALMAIFFLAYLIVFGRSGTLYFRYILPLAALVCLAAGMLVSVVLKSVFKLRVVRCPTMFATVIAVALLVEPATCAFRMLRNFTVEDTRIVAGRWIEENVEPGSRILITGYGNPPLRRNRESLKRLLGTFERQELLNKQYRAYRELLVQRGAGDNVRRMLPGSDYTFVALSEGLVADKAFDRTKIRFLLADPAPPAPAYDLAVTLTGAAVTQGRFIQRVKNREFDAVLIHPNESRKGSYAVLRAVAKQLAHDVKVFKPQHGRRRGPILELYLINRPDRGPGPLPPPHTPPGPDR